MRCAPITQPAEKHSFRQKGYRPASPASARHGRPMQQVPSTRRCRRPINGAFPGCARSAAASQTAAHEMDKKPDTGIGGFFFPGQDQPARRQIVKLHGLQPCTGKRRALFVEQRDAEPGLDPKQLRTDIRHNPQRGLEPGLEADVPKVFYINGVLASRNDEGITGETGKRSDLPAEKGCLRGTAMQFATVSSCRVSRSGRFSAP